MSGGHPPWTEDRTAALGALIDGGASITAASRALLVKRGAISGRAHRLGWRFGQPRSDDQRTPPFRVLRRSEPKPRHPRAAPEDRSVKVYCRFDRQTYDQIVGRAKATGESRTQIIRELVEWGLEA